MPQQRQAGTGGCIKIEWVLTIASLGMFAYGTYSAAWALVDIVRGARLEIWAELLILLFGLLLVLAVSTVAADLQVR